MVEAEDSIAPVVGAGPKADVGESGDSCSVVSRLEVTTGVLVIVTSLLLAAPRVVDSPSHTGQSTFFVNVSKHAGNLSDARPA